MIEKDMALPVSQDETWRRIDGHPDYIVSSNGRVRRSKVNAPILKGDIDRHGYRRVQLDGKRWKVHRLVCLTFHGACPAGHECAHNDGDRLNNRADNLRWATRSENVRDSITHGTFHNNGRPENLARGLARPLRGDASPGAKLTFDDVLKIRSSAGHISQRKLAAQFGISPGHVDRIISGKAWAHVS